ncbi:MAG: thioredoxin [Cyanobacteria bacterium]|nr:thioredoxin [Cyanobacteriota bacterium]MDW8200885.1 thioredoxin family protein [Cyanobacteriota bacterium SKYGB_h_bin112]
MSGVVSISDSEFAAEVLNASEALVLVYWWAPWCGPCRLVSPTIEWAADTFGDRLKVIKMEVDPNPETVATYKVEGVPALRLFQRGKVVESLEGAVTKQKLGDMLAAYLN